MKEKRYGDTVRESDYWRKNLGNDADGQKISGIFGASGIDYVEFDTDSEYTATEWQLIVFENSLTVTDPGNP